MTTDGDKSLMRSLGEFVGHVVKGIRTDPAADLRRTDRTEVRRTVETEDRGDVVLRRTTIEEVEVRTPRPSGPSED